MADMIDYHAVANLILSHAFGDEQNIVDRGPDRLPVGRDDDAWQRISGQGALPNEANDCSAVVGAEPAPPRLFK